MRKKEQTMPVGMALIVLLIVMTVLLAAYRGAVAETLPVLRERRLQFLHQLRNTGALRRTHDGSRLE